MPLLTNAAYPELVKSTIAKALIAHQHRVSAYLVNKMVTASGTALATGSVGSVGSNALNAVELVAETTRQQYRLADSHTIEVKAPHWLKSVIRADLASRNGVDLLAVTDADIARYFGARNVSVQFIFNWQSLANNAVGYPATARLLVYPAGTFVKGTADVISLDAVYDAASLSVNTMTGLFFEQGLLLLQNCYASKLVEIAVCAAGATGGRSTPTASRSDRRTKEREVTRMSDVKVEGLTSDNAILLLAAAEELKLSPRWCAPPPRGTSSPHRQSSTRRV